MKEPRRFYPSIGTMIESPVGMWIHIQDFRRATSTLAPLGAGGEGMKPSEVLLLSNLVKYNPHAWANLIRFIGQEAQFRFVHDMAEDRMLVGYRCKAGTHKQCMIDLNTTKVSDGVLVH